MTDPDPILAARFAEQITGDFPGAEIAVGGVVFHDEAARLSPRLLRLLWHAQGKPIHRGLIVQLGSIWLNNNGTWTYDGWHFDGRYCPGVVALEQEQVRGVTVVRALCGWHLPDLYRAQFARSPWLIRLKEIW